MAHDTETQISASEDIDHLHLADRNVPNKPLGSMFREIEAMQAVDDERKQPFDMSRAAQAGRGLIEETTTPARSPKDPELKMGSLAKAGAVVGLSALGVGTLAVGAGQAAPHIEDILAPQHSIVAEGPVKLDQGDTLIVSMKETADDLVLKAAIDPSKVNFSSITDRINESSDALGGENIQPGVSGELKLVDLGGTYTFEFDPNIQLPLPPALDDVPPAVSNEIPTPNTH